MGYFCVKKAYHTTMGRKSTEDFNSKRRKWYNKTVESSCTLVHRLIIGGPFPALNEGVENRTGIPSRSAMLAVLGLKRNVTKKSWSKGDERDILAILARCDRRLCKKRTENGGTKRNLIKLTTKEVWQEVFLYWKKTEEERQEEKEAVLQAYSFSI